MKANRKFKSDNSGYTAVISGLIALLIAIIIGLMVYFEVTEGIDEFDEVTETFTGYTRYAYGGGSGGQSGSNYTGIIIVLANSPNSASDVNITCWNGTGSSTGAEQRVRQTHPTVDLNHKTITIANSTAGNFTQVNITYTSHMAEAEGEDITPMAQTVFVLLPIIALVVVAAIIIGIVVTFGGGRRGRL